MRDVDTHEAAGGAPRWKRTLTFCAGTGLVTLAFGFASGWSCSRVDFLNHSARLPLEPPPSAVRLRVPPVPEDLEAISVHVQPAVE